MHSVAAMHGPVAPSVHVTALDAAPDGTTWSGAADGSITCWRQQQQAGDAVVQPVAVLQGHSHPVVALLSGLTGHDTSSSNSSGSSYLLSLDAEGWVGLWDCSSWVCLDMTRAAPLPPACTPTLLLMPDGEHVCIVIPATPNLQQEQHTLWQHQRQHQQHQQPAHSSPNTSAQQQQQHSATGPATAANLSPMMLVLRWQSLALVAAPLVSNLGLVALTSSSSTLDQADAVVASAVINTAPALAPTAADTVVLAVMRSGWMWAGSLAGSSLSQAWEQPLVTGGSSAPLRHSCLWATSSSSSSSSSSNSNAYSSGAGGSSSSPEPGRRSPGLQLLLLLVQPDGWTLFACSSFSSSDGMPQQWVQLAHQMQVSSGSRLHVHAASSCRQHETAGTSASAAGRMRFELSSSKAGAEGYSSSQSSCSSINSSSGGESGSESESEGVDAEDGVEGDGVVGPIGSRLRQVSGPEGRQHRAQQQGLQLLGGTLLQPPCSGADALQQQQQGQGQSAVAAVMVWSDGGEQQLWGVLQQPDSAMLPQQQQQVLVQCLEMQPWPAQAAAKVFAAVNRLHSSVSLLAQHSCHLRHHHHHHHHLQDHQHGQQQQQYQVPNSSSASSVEWLLSDAPHKWRSDWHLHCTQLAADSPSQLPQQQEQHGQQQQRGITLTPAQHLPWHLKHCQGALGAAWYRHGLYPCVQSTHDNSSSSSASHDSSRVADQDQQGELHSSSGSGAGLDAMQIDQNEHMISNSSRKRPAADAPAAESVGEGSVGQVGCGPEPGRAKQPRVQLPGAGLHSVKQAGAEQAAATMLGGQHQQVTHMLLLGSDAPGLHQVAVILTSGTLLFYDLATYCVPGAAWHPDCCVVGSGHVGRVSTTHEVTFKCPPQHLLGCVGAMDSTAWASTHGSLQRPVNWHFSSTAAGRADSSARSSHDGGWSGSADGSSSSRAAQRQCYEAVPECPAAAQGWCRRPAQGGAVPLLLTGGKDGSLRAWDLRLQHLGQPWMAVHPHTAPVEAIVLPPVSSRLPWSTCVLSVCASGRVALSCLASGTTTRTFDGWDLGPPAQLAWSTSRGLLAAGGWDAAGVWQVAVWDTYSGAMDRQLQGAAAHMLMASLAQELTSSMRHLSRAQAQQQAAQAPAATGPAASSAAGQLLGGVAAAAGTVLGAAGSGYGQYQSSGSSSGKRASFDAAHSSSQAASGDGAKGSSSTGAADAGCFTPRLQLVTHTGTLRPVPCGKQDVLVVDIDVQQLVHQLELYAKQQKRDSSRQRQQYTGSSQRSSMDVDSSTPSARVSRASSLDLLGLVQSGVVGTDALGSTGPSSAVPSSRTSPQQQQHMQAATSQYQQQQTPRAAAAAAGQLHALHSAAAAAISRQGSLASAAGAAVNHASTQGSSAQPAGGQSQQRRVRGRAAMAPAVAAALQGLCLLHKWGLEPKLDQQLLLLLEQLQGWRAAAAAAGELLTQSSSTSLPLSPTTPSTPAVSTAVPPAAHPSPWGEAQVAGAAAPQQLQLLTQLQVLLSGPAAGSPVLQPGAPCLSQEVLLSPSCHAAVIALPSAHSNSSMCSRDNTHQQQQLGEGRAAVDNQQSGSGEGVAAVTKPHAVLNKPPCLLLAACPSLLSCRLLTLVAVSKWLMATIPSHTSVNTCSGLVTLYALHSTELITQAAAAAAELRPTLGPLGGTSSSGGTSPIQPHPKQQQQQQQEGEQQLRRTGQGPVLPDLLLIASVSLACPGLLAEAAQLLLAALLQPAPPGTYLPPTLSLKQTVPQQLAWAGHELQQQQQQQEDVAHQVFTSPGAAAAASCWPPAVLQLAVLYAQQQHQHQQDTPPQGNLPTHDSAAAAAAGTAFSLHQLPLWLPQLVLSAAAAVAHPTRMPPELLAAVSAGLLDVLVGAAPAQSSCVAASWLCQVLRGGHWALWRPYMGKPGHLAQRLCHLIDRMQASSTDSRTAASHLVSQSLNTTSTGLQHTTAHGTSGSGISPATSGSSTGLSGDFVLLSHQAYAVADPLSAVGGISRGLSSSKSNTASNTSSSSSGWAKWRPQHIEGGLFLSSALMGSAAATKQGSWTPGGVSRSASPAAGAAAGLLEVSPVGRVVPAGGSGALAGSGWIAIGAGAAESSQQQAGLLDLHRKSSGVTYSYSGAQHSPGSSGPGAAVSAVSSGVKHGHTAGGLSSIGEQQQQQGMGVRVSRSVLVVWLRAALDVLAALTHVDPAAVLMELSHKLAAPGAESSGTSLTLLIAALSRLLKRTSERHALLPHLGFITALAVQALDPARPLLRHTLLQPVMGVVKDLASHFPQADCHSSSLQVAVGSTRALAGPYSGAGAAAGSGASAGASLSCIQAPTVAVFDMNGGAKKKVLLLPVLMDEPNQQQQQQGLQHASPAGPVHGHARPVGPFGSTGSLYSTTSSVSAAETSAVHIPQAQHHQAAAAAAGGALPGLWSSAEGVPGTAAGARGSSGYGGVLAGGSNSSLSSSTAFDTPADSRSSSYSRLGELQRGVLASSTMTRAEAAMVEGWFGGSPGSSTDGTAAGAGVPSATLHPAPGDPDGSTAAGAGWGGMPRPQQPPAMQCGVIYPDAASASSPVLCASEVSEGVAAVAFSPGGDAVAAFVLGCHCLVVWRLGASWTQKLAHLGSSRPMSQMPHAYIRLPQAALLVTAVFKDGAAGHKQQQQQHNHRHHHHHHRHHGRGESEDGEGACGEVLQWQLKWQTDSHIDLLYQGCLCGSVEVHL